MEAARSADYERRYVEAMEEIRRAAVRVIDMANPRSCLGLVEVPYPFITELEAALTAARYFPDVTLIGGEA